MFKKKFHIRVKHFYKGNYCVQYSYYRFFRIWHTIDYFYALNNNIDIHWHSLLFDNVKDAEKFAESFENYEKLLKYYSEEFRKEEQFNQEKIKRDKEKYPYKVKIIK